MPEKERSETSETSVAPVTEIVEKVTGKREREQSLAIKTSVPMRNCS